MKNGATWFCFCFPPATFLSGKTVSPLGESKTRQRRLRLLRIVRAVAFVAWPESYRLSCVYERSITTSKREAGTASPHPHVRCCPVRFRCVLFCIMSGEMAGDILPSEHAGSVFGQPTASVGRVSLRACMVYIPYGVKLG